MHFVIMGCGRVGATLARTLATSGHNVAVIDVDATSFRRLGSDFDGKTVTGMGFDRAVLLDAGIREADAFAAVSSGDNSNILAARVARETFGVERVAARIYDPRRAMVYQRLGIPTVATVRWTAEQIIQRLVPHGALPAYTDPSGKVALAEVPYAREWIGLSIPHLEALANTRVAMLTRLGDGMVPGPTTVLQDGDLLHVVAASTDLDHLERVFAAAPPHE
ncbi:MAG: TrkA family potassium uptake protein [Dermatophilaceae bacterium]|nr:TrkA family potassium uptake protein [Actinomycetales bacterium]